jgi:hypothetical protein
MAASFVGWMSLKVKFVQYVSKVTLVSYIFQDVILLLEFIKIASYDELFILVILEKID